MVSDPRRNPRSIRWGDQRALRLIKIGIEKSKYKLFLIKHRAVGSSQDKWYLLQVDMDKLDMVTMRYYGLYQ